MLLSTLFSNILNICLSHRVRDQVSQKYRTASKILVLYILRLFMIYLLKLCILYRFMQFKKSVLTNAILIINKANEIIV
jgi:hypothetical protein